MRKQPLKLYGVADRQALTAFLGGYCTLGAVLAHEDDRQTGSAHLSTVPYPPFSRKETIVELTFDEPGVLEPYAMQTMDSTGKQYTLPESILRSGRLRAFSNAEIVDVAREVVECIPPPGMDPLWKIMKQCSPKSRVRRFGPYLCQAFAQRSPHP